jgi:hypothetical protein
VVIFLILLSKIKKITTHSLFYFAAEGGEILLRQPRLYDDPFDKHFRVKSRAFSKKEKCKFAIIVLYPAARCLFAGVQLEADVGVYPEFIFTPGHKKDACRAVQREGRDV